MGKEGAFGDERWTYLLRAAIAIAPRLPALFCRFSYFQNVCTQSYSMWWWSWDRWQREIDWAALWGVNLMLAYTGQEHVFREVFNSIGVNDSVLNTTFDGPAFLTWSRGQGQFGFGVRAPRPPSHPHAFRGPSCLSLPDDSAIDSLSAPGLATSVGARGGLSPRRCPCCGPAGTPPELLD